MPSVSQKKSTKDRGEQELDEIYDKNIEYRLMTWVKKSDSPAHGVSVRSQVRAPFNQSIVDSWNCATNH